MNTGKWTMITIAAGVVGLTGVRAAAQGSLTPPGAPGQTMKTLYQLWDAISDVNARVQSDPRTPISSAPYTITQPGSYYLTTNLSSTGNGIIIKADRVTVDLMGFSLTGDRGSADYGIWMDGATNAFVRDIVVHGGIVSGFGYGVMCENTQNSRMEGLMLSSNAYSGVELSGVYGQCDGNIIANCVVSSSGSYGVYLTGGNGQCDGNAVDNCVISDSSQIGIGLFGQSGHCEGNAVVHCVLRNNTNRGISVAYAAGNRIANNHVSGTTGAPSYGIYTAMSSANLILQNTCVGQTNNYNIDPSDTYGPIVTDSGAMATTNGAAALSPWANFSR